MDKIKQAIDILKEGGLVIFPTDTAYGIGCRIDDKKAVQKLFDIRKRPRTKAVPVLVSSVEMAEEYVESIDNDVRELMKKYWPARPLTPERSYGERGALTIVLKCKIEKVPEQVRGFGNTLGVRMPDNQDTLKIIQEVGVPILAPSANFSGGNTPFRSGDLDKNLISKVDFVLKEETKGRGLVSTVIDCSEKPWKTLREGAVVVKELTC